MTDSEENKRLCRISDEVFKEGGAPERWLRAKCNWEHMTRMGVIQEWGDPRDWKE